MRWDKLKSDGGISGMKKDVLFLVLSGIAFSVVLLDLSYVIYVLVNLRAYTSGKYFLTSEMFAFSIIVTIINVVTAAFVIVYRIIKRRQNSRQADKSDDAQINEQQISKQTDAQVNTQINAQK